MICIDIVTVRRKNCEPILNKEKNNELENMKISLRSIRALLLINYNIFVLKHGQCGN